MARKKEEGAEGKEGKAGKGEKTLSDRKRFAYLRVRSSELRKESLAIKKEMSELRVKIGKGKGKGKPDAEAGDGDED